MSRAEGQPLESQSLKPKEHKPKKVGKIAGYLASLAIAGFGVNQIVEMGDSGYSEFYQQNPQVRWAQDIESDFRVEINRVLLENDSQGLEDLKDRLPIVSSALTTLDQHEGKIPANPKHKFFSGGAFILLSLVTATATKVFSDEYESFNKATRELVDFRD